MFSFLFKRKQKRVNDGFSVLAKMLTQYDDNPTYKRELFTQYNLDYSLESLRYIDEYLEQIRLDRIDDQEYMKIVLRCGAYTGQTICHIEPKWHWIDHEEACKYDSFLSVDEPRLDSTGVLQFENEDLIMFPLGKVMKFIENGSEDSIYGLASIALDPSFFVAMKAKSKI